MLKRLLVLMLMMTATAAYADSPDKVVNEVMHDYMQKNNVPGAAVLIYTDGKPTSYYFGYADLGHKKPVTKDTIFELGSLTKLMTTLLLAQEVDYAKIKLQDPVTKYIPTLPASFSNLTMRSLATHTTGLPLFLPSDIKNRADWEQKYAANWKADFAPDTQFRYSNVGIGLIGQALEAVTHESFDKLYRTKILDPLGMQPIGLTVPKKLQVNIAQGYDEKGLPAPPVSGLFPSAGCMKASAEDMRKFLSASIGLPQTPESIFYPIRMTQTPYLGVKESAQGLGWVIHDMSPENLKALSEGSDGLGIETRPVVEVYSDPVFNGADLIDKTGTTDGFRAYIAVLPNKKSGIVILANRRDNSNSIVVAARDILFKLNDIH